VFRIEARTLRGKWWTDKLGRGLVAYQFAIRAGACLLSLTAVPSLAQPCLVARSNNPLLPRRYILGIALLAALLVGALVFTPMARRPTVPPLPFDTNAFITTTLPTPNLFTAPPGASLFQRFAFLLLKPGIVFGRQSSGTWSFPTSPGTGCSIEGLLDQCMQVSGTRYLMPVGVAAGIVQFGHTNVLDGPHWVAAFENALQSNAVQCWDPQTQITAPDHLLLLRFPAQKVVVVLPAKAAVKFQRTNGIHLTAQSSFPEK
jgi:hypothetical protein